MKRMPATPDELRAFLTKLGVQFTLHRHAPLHTVVESQALRGEIPGLHTKNLFLRDKPGRLFLLSAAEDARIDLKTAHVALGGAGRLSFASADKLEHFWGVRPGAVTPFGAINDKAGLVTVILEARLMGDPLINAHPLVNTMTTSIGREDLVRFLVSTGHEPLILAVPRRTEAAEEA